MGFTLCAVVTLYHPDLETIDNINSYLPFVDKIYLMDNSDHKNEDKTIFSNLINTNKDKVVYLNFDVNNGISKAVNIAAKKAFNLGFSHMLIMDQDSSFDKNQLEIYLNCISKDIESGGAIDLYGPSLEGAKSFLDENNIPIMTSGSIVHTNKFIEVGGYSEKLFIDEVDHEFSLRMLDSGYKIKKLGSVRIKHYFGKETIIGKNSYRKYPFFRYYYFTRNYFYLRKYHSINHLEFVLRRRKHLISKMKNVLKYDRNRFICIYYMVLGWVHAKIGIWGKGISF